VSVSTFRGIETTLRGLLAQQRALDVTGHNIANANTIGYTRQRADLAATRPLDIGPQGLLGSGVDVTGFRRVRDDFIDVQLRAQSLLKGAADARQDGLAQVELVLNEPSDRGLSTVISRYFAAWQDLTSAPENMATRQSLVESAKTLAEGFNALAGQLATIGDQTAGAVTNTVGEANSLGRDLLALNEAIKAAQAVGHEPNDLKDQRDVVLDKLGAIGSVGVRDDDGDGAVTVTLNGVTLIDGTTLRTLSESGGVLSNDAPTPESATITAELGKLGGLVELRDRTLPGYRASLDTLAATIITQTNAIHGGGPDANGVVRPGGVGLDGVGGRAFFSGTDAASMAVAVLPEQVAAAAAAGKPGDASNAQLIAGIRADATLAPLAGATIGGAYAQLVTRIGSDSREARRASENATVLTDALENRRQSVSGVSVDEEMTNLVKFQRGYQASARALNAMDEMIDLLINRTGRVGL
jgi:flagellar hook-associated protein 1 FlgK